ncbi:MAG: hypothetical protein L3J54_14540 [Draconibacterium sp.]|nr:hypothetical protein [Draconibacterium sp.]
MRLLGFSAIKSISKLFRLNQFPSIKLQFVYCRCLYNAGELLNRLQLIPDILIRSSIFTVVFGGVVLLLRVSGDVDGMLRKLLRRE